MKTHYAASVVYSFSDIELIDTINNKKTRPIKAGEKLERMVRRALKTEKGVKCL